MLGHNFSLHSLSQLLDQLYHNYQKSFKPDGEHKRSILPGQYKKDLRPETIANAKFLYSAKLAERGYVIDA